MRRILTTAFHKGLPCPGISQHVLFLMAAGNPRGDIFSKSGILSILKQRLLTPTLRSILARLDINYKQSVNRYLLCYYVIYFVFKVKQCYFCVILFLVFKCLFIEALEKFILVRNRGTCVEAVLRISLFRLFFMIDVGFFINNYFIFR